MKVIVSVIISCLLLGECVYAAPQKEEAKIEAVSGYCDGGVYRKMIYEKECRWLATGKNHDKSTKRCY